MAEQANELSEEEKQKKNEMLFTLSDRDRGTLAMIVTNNEWKKNELYQFLKGHLQGYHFFDLDLTPHTYISLYKALQELLPSNVLQSEPVQYLVSVTGLESSLYKTEDGKVEFSSLVAQLNFERELIFRQPYIILLWVNEGFDRELRKKAPDLMHWMSKRFVFDEDKADGFEVAEEAISYGVVKKKGKIPERQERIRQLEETWGKLCWHHEDQARLIKDKINLLLLLGKEYGAAFEFEKAEEAFKKASTLNDRIGAGQEIELCYQLGSLYYNFHKYDLALNYFEKTLDLASKTSELHLGNIYHMMGMSSAGKQKWGEALKNYEQALEWYEKMGNEYELADTYHQIGMVYEEQQKWDGALKNYEQALEWYKKTGNEYELGGTYHQIGMVYGAQRKWDEALKNYEQALEWKMKTGNEYEVGMTYHQIGRVYQGQRKWEEALKNYERALEWKMKTGNEYELGSTYHQIGRVYEERRELNKALEYFQKTLENESKYDHFFLDSTKQSIARIEEKIKALDTQSPPAS